MASSMDKLAKELKKQITASDERKPKPYDTQAEVLRVENGVAWVHIPGGVDETPVRLTINAKKGDNVNLHVANGTAWITGNSTNPPTDDSTANYAVDISNEVKKDVTVLNTVVAENIEATNARFTNVEADTAKIHDLTADNLHATVGYIEDLTADSITANDISAASGYIKDLEADDITAQDISASSGYIKDLEADNITAQDISASSGYIKDLTAGNVTAQNVIADHATVGNLDANYAKVNAANIDSAAIRNAWVDKIMVQTGLLAYSSQIYTLDAIEVNAANITAGTLDVNRLIVTVGEGSSAQKYLVNIDPSTGTPSYEKLDGNIVEPRTITANKIVANSITTDEITVNNLVGTSGWINLHEGKFFYGNGADFATATNAISWNGSKLQIKADEFLLSSGKSIFDEIEAIETWFYAVAPTTSNPPANSWTTEKLKELHLRDIYFDTTSGKSYRWAKEGSTYKWVEIEDVELAALAGRVSTAETNIAQNAENISLTAEKSVYMSKPNLSPFFQSTPFNSNGGYWTNIASTFTPLNDGWAHFLCDNTSGTDTVSNLIRMVSCPSVFDGERYTCLVEIRNLVSNATSASMYTQQSAVGQFWGSTSTGGFSIANDSMTNGSYYKPMTALGVSEHGTDGTRLMYINWQVPAGAKIEADIRISLYEGEYTGEYKPYVGAQMYASQAELKIANDNISSKVSTTDYNGETIASLINQTADTVKIEAEHIELDGTTTFNAIKSKADAAYDKKGAASTAESNAKDYADTAVDAIEVGGRNLLLDTDAPSVTKVHASSNRYWSSSGTTGYTGTFEEMGELPAYGAKYAVRLKITDNFSVIHFLTWYSSQNACVNLVRGEQYTMSVWCKKVSGTEVKIAFQYGQGTYHKVLYPLENDSEWHRYSYTFIADTSDDYYYANSSQTRIYLAGLSSSAASEALFCGFKLEKGNKATDWSPAPEDIQAEIDAVDTKADGANSQEQRIYYRSNSTSAPTAPSTWVVSEETTNATWSTKRMQYDSTYKYLYTCIQRKTVGGTITNSTVLLDDTTTVIDGGNIITGTVAANAVDASSGTFDTANIPNLNASKITAGNIAAARMKVNSIAAINSLTTGKIDADRLNVGQITVGDLSDGSSYSTTEQMNTAIGNAVDDVAVGGRNLILNTVRQRVSPSSATASSNYPSPTPTLSDYGHSIMNNTDDEWTYSFDYEVTGNSSTTSDIYVQIRGNMASGSSLVVSGNKSGHYSKTFKLSSTQAAATSKQCRIRLRNATDGAVLTVSNIKLEKGNKETDWSTAPEDYITDIDGIGVRIHPASTEDNSVVINADGMEVFKGGTGSANSVAFYGDTTRIGKESGSHISLASDSMSMSDGNKDVFNLIQKTMYIYWTRNYKGRQFTNSTDRHIDSWDTNASASTWTSLEVNYKLNNTSKKKTITSISNGVLADDEIYIKFNYSGTIVTLTYGRGGSAASTAVIKLESATIRYITDEQLSEMITGAYPDTTLSGALRIGNGKSNSDHRNVMLVDWGGNAKFRGDVLAFCNPNSSGGMSLTKTEENLEICTQSDSKGTVTIDSYRVGRMVVLRIHMELAGTTAAGQRINTVSLSGKHLPKPLGNSASGASYYGTHSIGLFLNYNSSASRYEIAIHNASSTAFTPVSGYDLYGTLTYICEMDSFGNIEYVDD